MAEELRSRISRLRRSQLQPKPALRLSFWTKRDRMFHAPGIVHYAILDTGGCRWARESGGCSMCGYLRDTCMRDVSREEITDQVKRLVAMIPRSKGPFGLRIFTSGSFFDERELPCESRQEILDGLRAVEGLAELTVESRPECIGEDKVSMLKDELPNVEVEVAVGLESSSDRVRNECIGKGFTFSQFTDACSILRRCGVRTKAYVLLKPPFLSEFDAYYDALQTIKDVSGIVDSVSLNACNVHKGTLVEQLFSEGRYRPPWIWTVMEVLREAKEILGAERNVICDTVAFGTPRGPHNCKVCDRKTTALVRTFSLSQDAAVLGGARCSCKGNWAKIYNYHF